MSPFTKNRVFLEERKDKYPFWVLTDTTIAPTKIFASWFNAHFVFAKTMPGINTWGFVTEEDRQRFSSHLLQNNITHKVVK